MYSFETGERQKFVDDVHTGLERRKQKFSFFSLKLDIVAIPFSSPCYETRSTIGAILFPVRFGSESSGSGVQRSRESRRGIERNAAEAQRQRARRRRVPREIINSHRRALDLRKLYRVNSDYRRSWAFADRGEQCTRIRIRRAVCSMYGKSARRWSTIVSISRVSATFGTDSIDAVD